MPPSKRDIEAEYGTVIPFPREHPLAQPANNAIRPMSVAERERNRINNANERYRLEIQRTNEHAMQGRDRRTTYDWRAVFTFAWQSVACALGMLAVAYAALLALDFWGVL